MAQYHEEQNGYVHSHDQEGLHFHAHGHGHGHVHDNQKAVINRLSRAIGHLEKVKRMVEEGYDCSEVLIQLAAVRSALDNTGKVILRITCVTASWMRLLQAIQNPSTTCVRLSISS